MDGHPAAEPLALQDYMRMGMRRGERLEFDDAERNARVQRGGEPTATTQAAWAQQCRTQHTVLQLLAVQASSTDYPHQNMEHTPCSGKEGFWSSCGTPSGDVEEALLYRLVTSAAVRFVALTLFRAVFLNGEPVYPPSAMSVYLGPSPTQLRLASRRYAVLPTHKEQVFAVAPGAPPATYMLLRMHGKTQCWEDMQHYIAIQQVVAYGDTLGPQGIARVLGAVKSHQQLTWQPCPPPALPSATAPRPWSLGPAWGSRCPATCAAGAGLAAAAALGGPMGTALGALGTGPCQCCFEELEAASSVHWDSASRAQDAYAIALTLAIGTREGLQDAGSSARHWGVQGRVGGSSGGDGLLASEQTAPGPCNGRTSPLWRRFRLPQLCAEDVHQGASEPITKLTHSQVVSLLQALTAGMAGSPRGADADLRALFLAGQQAAAAGTASLPMASTPQLYVLGRKLFEAGVPQDDAGGACFSVTDAAGPLRASRQAALPGGNSGFVKRAGVEGEGWNACPSSVWGSYPCWTVSEFDEAI